MFYANDNAEMMMLRAPDLMVFDANSETIYFPLEVCSGPSLELPCQQF